MASDGKEEKSQAGFIKPLKVKKPQVNVDILTNKVKNAHVDFFVIVGLRSFAIIIKLNQILNANMTFYHVRQVFRFATCLSWEECKRYYFI